MYEMTRHMRDAIRVNTRRAPLYARLCDGRSWRYSRALIRSERMSLPATFWFDLRGNRYQRRGIPIVAEEFLDMLDPADFIETFPEHIDFRQSLRKVSLNTALNAIAAANGKGDWPRIITICNEQIDALADQPHVYRMTRHLLESIRRGAAMAPRHQERAEKLGVAAPTRLSRHLIWLQVRSIPRAQSFDEGAAEVQQMGVPFLYYDLPTIGTDPQTPIYMGQST